jgi:hypothetical protein
MDTIILKRQLITDATGKPVGIILPLAEYAMVAPILENNFAEQPLALPVADVGQTARTSIKEAAFFGMWADRSDLEELSSRAWLEELRQKQWDRHDR